MLLVLFSLAVFVAAQPSPEDTVIRPGIPWFDTDGNRIYAGGLGFVVVNNVYACVQHGDDNACVEVSSWRGSCVVLNAPFTPGITSLERVQSWTAVTSASTCLAKCNHGDILKGFCPVVASDSVHSRHLRKPGVASQATKQYRALLICGVLGPARC